MRDLIGWNDNVVQYPNRYREVQISEGVVELKKDPGEIIQQGTPMSAKHFNIMDYAAFEAMLMASESSRVVRILNNYVAGLIGEKIQVTLTNSQQYPHNNSKKTVQLLTKRNDMDYTVECEVVNVTGGSVGEFEFSDKLLNGFKISFTGSAKSVVVNCYVRGGI